MLPDVVGCGIGVPGTTFLRIILVFFLFCEAQPLIIVFFLSFIDVYDYTMYGMPSPDC